MTKDEAIGERLVRAADPVDFDVESSLRRVTSVAPRRTRRTRVATVVFALAVALVGVVVAWRLLPDGGRNDVVAPDEPVGAIAYMAVADGGRTSSIRTVDAASADVSEFAAGGFAAYPVWSPDGTRVAYMLDRSGDDDDTFGLYVADADGADARSVVDSGVQYAFTWSPDGEDIVYGGSDDEGMFGLYEVSVIDGSRRMLLPGYWESVAWSPDGQLLLLTGYETKEVENPQSDVYTVRPDGSQLTNVTDDTLYEHWASWSPDGTLIAFARSRDYDDVAYTSDVYIADGDGSNVLRMTRWDGFDALPVWSPNGEWIAFSSDRAATPEQQRANHEDEAFTNISLFVMRADGSDARMLVEAHAGETLLAASWKVGG